MECVAPLGSVYQAGTLSGNPCAVAAGTAQLKLIENTPDLYERINSSAERLYSAMLEVGLNANRCGSLLTVFFTDRQVTDYDAAVKCDTGKFAEYWRHMLENGIYAAPSQFEAMFVSYAHSDEDIDRTVDAIKSFKLR